MTFFTYIYPLIYFTSISVGIFNYQKFRHNKYLKLFLYFLIYSFFSEVVGLYVGNVLIVKNNFVYNTWNIVNLLFLTYFFLNKIRTRLKRIIVYVLITSFILITLINIIFYSNYIVETLLNNILLAKSMVVILIIIYFTEILEDDTILNFKNNLYFWIALGVFLYNVVFLPAIALVKYTSVFGMFKYITLGLNLIMHTCFITGFIISKKEYNS